MNVSTPTLQTRRIGISLFFFFYGFSFASWASRIPTIQQTMGLTETGLGAVLLAMPVGSFLTLPFSGYLVSKIGSRTVVIFSCIVYACMLSVIGFAHQIWMLTLGMFLFGSSGNMMNIAINTQAIALEKLYGRTIISSFHGMWSAAGLAAAFTGTWLMGKAFPVGLHFAVVSTLCILVFITCVPLLLTDAPKLATRTPLFPKPDRTLAGLGTIAFCSMICQGAMFDWSGVYFKKEVTSNLAYIGFGYTAFMISMTVTRFITDWINHHLGFRNVISWCGVFTTAGLLVTVYYPSVLPATIGMLMVGIGVSPIVPLVFSAAGKTRQANPALAIAAVSTIGFLGLLIGPPLIGFIAGWSSLKTSFIVLTLFGISIFAGGRLINFAPAKTTD